MATWNPLRGWLRPRWQNPDPDVRRRAAMELKPDDPETDAILATLADDDAVTVREAALKRIADLDILRRHLDADPAPAARTAASVRYRQVLIGSLSTDDAVEELARCPDATILGHVARQARQPQVRRAALARIETRSLIIEAALHDDDPDVRLHALDQLQDRAALQRLIDDARVLGDETGPARTDVVRRAQARLAPTRSDDDADSAVPAVETTEHTEVPPHPTAPPEARPTQAPPRKTASPAPEKKPRRRPPARPNANESALLEAYRACVTDTAGAETVHARRRVLLRDLYKASRNRAPAARAATQDALHKWTIQALMAPTPPAPDAVAEHRTLIRESSAARLADPERLNALAAPGGPLQGEHPEESQVRRQLQVALRAHHGGPGLRLQTDPSHDQAMARSAQLAHLLADAEDAAARGDLEEARSRIARARTLTGPADGGTASPQS